MMKRKTNAHLNRTLRELEKSLAAWDSVKDQTFEAKLGSSKKEKSTALNTRESELSLRTHLLFLMLKEQIDELSSAETGTRPRSAIG